MRNRISASIRGHFTNWSEPSEEPCLEIRLAHFGSTKEIASVEKCDFILRYFDSRAFSGAWIRGFQYELVEHLLNFLKF